MTVPAALASATFDLSSLLSARLPVLAQPVFTCRLEYLFQDAPVHLEASLAIPVLESKDEVQAARNKHVEELFGLQLASLESGRASELLKQGKEAEAAALVKDQIRRYESSQKEAHCAEGTYCYRDASVKMRRAQGLAETIASGAVSQAAKIKTASYAYYNMRGSSSFRDEL